MTPRPYTPGERKRAVDEGRDRILAAARDALQTGDIGAFSLEAIAQRAGVTRMTVYNQFGSRAGLLEELFDLLVTREAFSEMPSDLCAEGPGGGVRRHRHRVRALLCGQSNDAGADARGGRRGSRSRRSHEEAQRPAPPGGGDTRPATGKPAAPDRSGRGTRDDAGRPVGLQHVRWTRGRLANASRCGPGRAAVGARSSWAADPAKKTAAQGGSQEVLTKGLHQQD